MRLFFAAIAATALLTGSAAGQCSALANTPPGTDLQLGDDELRTVGLGFPFAYNGATFTTVTVCSNGFLWLGTVDPDDFAGQAANFQPNEAEFLATGPRIAPCWHDWDPSGGGGVYFTTDGSSAAVVWSDVPSFASPSVRATMEVVLSANGQLHLNYAPTMSAPANSAISGLSAGGGIGANQLTWSTFLPGTVLTCTGYQVFASSAFSLAGQTLQLVPTGSQSVDFLGQVGTLTPCATGTYPPLAGDVVSYGTGCPTLTAVGPSALYELFTPTGGGNPTDLAGTSIVFQRAGTTYTTGPGPGFDTSYLAQGTPMLLPDESISAPLSLGAMGSFPFATIDLTAVRAADNGFLDLLGTLTPDFSPTAAELVGANGEGPRIAPHWSDYDMSFAGTFWWSNDDPNFCMATWANVEMYSQPGTSNTFQVKLLANGDIVFSYGSVSSAFSPVLAGIALGNGAPDPGPVDLDASIATPLTRDLGQLILPLTHTSSGRAAIRTEMVLRADRVPSSSPFGLFVLGLGQTNIDLTPAGMPGCTALVTLDFSLAQLLVNQTSMQQPFFIPNDPLLIGATVNSQVAVFAALNPFGVVTSNALTWSIGL